VYARWENADTANDLVQETFLRLLRAWEQDETIENPKAWLARVARNLSEDQAKSAFRRHGTRPPQTMSGVEARDPSPEAQLLEKERLAQLQAQLHLLSSDDQRVLHLRYVEDLTTPEIASALGTTVVAVHMRLSRARARLRALLKTLE
jgi:RNA polymerase sigma-70 factor (ECF subfamily)